MAHSSLLPGGEAPWGVTAEQATESDVFAHDAEGRLTFIRAGVPRQMSTDDVALVVAEFRQAARNAALVGFDGVELHAANGYLFDQFMNSTLNTRTDRYGGQTPETRTRFLLDVVDAAISELGADSIGVRVSPYGRYNSMPFDPLVEETLMYLCGELGKRGVAYLHLVYQLMPSGNVEDSHFDQDHLGHDLLGKLRAAFRGTLIWTGGFDGVSAQAALDTGNVDLIAFGRPFIGNPDLVARLRHGWPVVEAPRSAYYTRNGAVGYTDFPVFDGNDG
jgi:N-ethylmaleimide reductase